MCLNILDTCISLTIKTKLSSENIAIAEGKSGFQSYNMCLQVEIYRYMYRPISLRRRRHHGRHQCSCYSCCVRHQWIMLSSIHTLDKNDGRKD